MIAIVDYGVGNLHSVRHALTTVGADAVVTCRPEDLRLATRVVLPGVGAFGECVKRLRAAPELLDCVREEVRDRGKPLLAICVGMQLLATTGEEDGVHDGLGWIPGRVVRLDADRVHGLNVPHTGWNEIESADPLFAGLGPDATFYFVHSFHFVPDDPSVIAATTEHGDRFVAAVRRENIFATQFHPEKSQHDGLQLLSNWLAWDP